MASSTARFIGGVAALCLGCQGQLGLTSQSAAPVGTDGVVEQGAADGGSKSGAADARTRPGDTGTSGLADASVDAVSAGPTVVITPGNPGTADIEIVVNAAEARRSISPLIYGTNDAPEIATTHQGVVRSGGNRLTAYNWENNASNAGSDYQFQNDGNLSSSNVPGQAVAGLVDTALAHGAATLVTVPIVDYVAADKNGGGDVRNSGSNYLSTRFKKNKPTKGAALSTTPSTSDGFVYQDEFVSWIKGKYPQAQILFSLDNEPDLWSSTHAEVHPQQTTYAELWQRNSDYARAVKGVWPQAEVLGFVSYGFGGYVNLQNAPDANNRNFVEWYLDQARAAETSGGQRLIDYLDLHWYPEAEGGGARIIDATSQAAAVAREQAPRSLWDASYREVSWVADYVGGPIDLLHMMQKKIDAHYPGTKLAFTEWNFGGGDEVSGAIAAADVLGVFGREGVGLATYWDLHSNETYAHAAIRLYRNYDGAGGAFGDVSISTTTSDSANSSAYASVQSNAGTRTVIVVINKATTSKRAGITISQSVKYTSAKVFQLVAGKADVVSAAAINPVATNAFLYTMPAQSVSVLVPQP